MKDYYSILGVKSDASDDQIRSAYKKLAMQHHPDRGGDSGKFQEIQEAYNILSNPQKKHEYEHQKHFENAGGFQFNFSFGDGGIHDIFRQMHSAHFNGMFKQGAINRDLRTQMHLDLESTLENQNKIIEIANNNGKRTVQVNIPRGVQSNMQMRFSGHGDNSIPNIPAGDLYVDFIVKPHPVFNVDGINLITKKRINAIDAVLGLTTTVTGLDGKLFTINVSQGTQPGTNFKFTQQGLWDLNHPVRGDLIVVIDIEVPKSISREQLNKLNTITHD